MPHILHPYKTALMSGDIPPLLYQTFLTNTAFPSWLDVSATTGNRMLYDSTGKLTFAPNNHLLNTATLSTQSVTTAASNYILSFKGTGSVSLSGAYSGSLAGTGANDRVYLKFTSTAASLTLTVTGTVTEAQLEAVTWQTTPSDYVANTGLAYFGPRFDYVPSTLAARGLLIEESRANLATYSEQFNNAAWTKTRATVSANATTAPDGTTTADKIVADTSTGTHYLGPNGLTLTANTSYIYSLFLKKSEFSQVVVTRSGAGITTGVTTVNLSAGTLTSTGTATITSVGNDWYRLTILISVGASNTSDFPYVYLNVNTSYTGDGTSGVFFWGAQLEVGSFATSYIPTVAASVTRPADIIKLGGSALTTLQGSAGTFLQEATILGNNSAAQYGVYGNSVSPAYWDSLVVKATNGTNVLSSGQTAVIGTAGRAGLAWNASGRAISYSASTAVTDANSFGTIGSTVYLGSNNGSNALNGWVRALSFYDKKLPNASLTAKTTVGGAL